MPDTRAPVDPLQIHAARRQHTAAADRIANRIINCAHAVKQDLVSARPPGPAARQLILDAQALLETLAELRTIEKMAGWARKPAALPWMRGRPAGGAVSLPGKT